MFWHGERVWYRLCITCGVTIACHKTNNGFEWLQHVNWHKQIQRLERAMGTGNTRGTNQNVGGGDSGGGTGGTTGDSAPLRTPEGAGERGTEASEAESTPVNAPGEAEEQAEKHSETPPGDASGK